MTGSAPLLTLLLICAVVTTAGLLAAGPGRNVLPVSKDAAGRRLVEASRSWRRRGTGPSADALRRDAGLLLHQYAALLQSGRTPAQSWADLRLHWRSQEVLHPLAGVCESAASAEQAGLGSAVGLRRSLDSLVSAQHPRAGPGSALGTLGASGGSGATATATAVLGEVLERLITIHALSQSTGAPLSELCRRAAESLEDSALLDAAVRTAAAGPRLTQLLLALLPLGGLAMGVLMGADPFAVLLGSTLGWGCLVLGLGSLLLGWHWSARMIRSVERHE